MKAASSPRDAGQSVAGAKEGKPTTTHFAVDSAAAHTSAAPLSIAVAKTEGLDATLWRQTCIIWEDFLGWLDAPADHKECYGYVFGELDGKGLRRRTKNTVRSRSALTLDVDSPGRDFLDRLKGELSGHAVAIHTTYSATASAPRYRVVVPLAAALPPEDYRAAVGELIRRVEDGTEFDRGSSQPERLMFKPSVQPGQTFWSDVWVGDRLDGATLVEAAQTTATNTSSPELDDSAGPDDPRAYFLAAADREEDLLAFGFEGSRNEALNRAAFKLGQLAHLWPEGDADDPATLAEDTLRRACGVNGLTGESDGEAEFSRTFGNGWRAGTAEPRDVKPVARTGNGEWGVADRETRGQRRMAHRLANLYRGRLLNVHGVGWHHWTGTYWAEDKSGTVSRALDNVLRLSHHQAFGDQDLTRDVMACQSGAAAAGILDIARSLEGMSATVDEMDADPWALNVANGLLDLHTLELGPHRPEDRCTKITRGAYNPGAAGPGWRRFLESSLPDLEVRSFLQRYVGQALIGRFIEKKMVLLKGEGDNGKSVWSESIANALGDYAMSAQPDMLLVKKNQSAFDGTVELRGRRWAVISEVEQGRELAPATVKRLTGGDRIRARNLREKNIEFDPSHTLVMLVNHLPNVTDKTEAMWERLRVVRWDVVIPRERRDPLLTEKLEAEADAVLCWAVAGLRDYQQRDGLDEPQQVRLATGAYREDNDDVSQFFYECVEANPEASVAPTVLHTAYKHWCHENRVNGVLGRKGFGEEVRRLKGLQQGGRNLTWQGISLRQPEVEEFSDDLT